MNTRHAAGIVLFTRQTPTQFLLMKHRKRWDLPKGHAEPGEDIRETALRETEEETGVSRTIIELDEHFQFKLEYEVQGKKRGSYHKIVTYYLGYIAEPLAVKPTEHPGYQWFTWPVPPIQAETIDPLLMAIAEYFKNSQNAP